MTKVRWTPQAADDLEAIYEFIARDSPHYAQITVEGIIAAIDRLEQFPLLGRHVPETSQADVRELIKPPCRIVSNGRNREDSYSLPWLSFVAI